MGKIRTCFFFLAAVLSLTSCYFHDNKPEEAVSENGDRVIKNKGFTVSTEDPKGGSTAKKDPLTVKLKVSRTSSGQLDRPLRFQQIDVSFKGNTLRSLTTDEMGQAELVETLENGEYVLSTTLGSKVFSKNFFVEGRGPFEWIWQIEK